MSGTVTRLIYRPVAWISSEPTASDSSLKARTHLLRSGGDFNPAVSALLRDRDGNEHQPVDNRGGGSGTTFARLFCAFGCGYTRFSFSAIEWSAQRTVTG
jgi:hypothetical protein